MDQLLDLIANTDKTAKQILHDFIESQKQSWPLAAANYRSLENVVEKSFQFDGFQVKVQYNPERLQSSVAKTDKQSIAKRRCFLCNKNRPIEQKAIGFGDQFLILVNPFPIFRNHFTISSNLHVDQRFLPNVPDLLKLAESMEGFTVLYNGPECGASAPDHLHFQAGEIEFLPVNEEFQRLKLSARQLYSDGNTKIWAFENYLRKMISIETNSMAEGLEVIHIYYKYFQAMQPEKVEPMMNALCSWSGGKWTIHLFPRKAHRPTQYYETGEGQILISPGSVDFGGVFVIPRKEDFKKLTKENIEDIFAQVSLSQDDFQVLTNQIEADLKVRS